jgi:FO synthase
MTKAWAPDEARDLMMKLKALPQQQLFARSEAMTVAGHGTVVTYSRKVFIPLTQLCRDVCHYCTFAKRPSELAAPFLELEAVLDIARAGEAAGCREALFTLGDQPETRYAIARDWLSARGYSSTLDYVAAAAKAVLAETTLLPHLNPGLMGADDYAVLRPLSASMGLMLESASDRLCAKGMPHYGSPDKVPAARLESIRLAGEAQVPFTTGLLIGIGETQAERVEALLAIRDLHARYGHIQEVIIQNFCAKDATQMAGASEPSLDDHLWTIAAARLILGPDMTIQAPPNLREGSLAASGKAGNRNRGRRSPLASTSGHRSGLCA